jgi:hypothetical protein
MSATVTHLPPPRLKRTFDSVGIVVLLIVIGTTFAGLERLVRGPEFVDRLTVHNPTDVPVAVSVSGDGRDTRLPIATIEARRSATIRSVVDLGDTWTFEFRLAGTKVGALRASRAALEGAGWRVVVPEETTPG